MARVTLPLNLFMLAAPSIPNRTSGTRGTRHVQRDEHIPDSLA